MSGADLGSGPEDGLTSFGAAIGAADETSDGLTSLGVAAGAASDTNDEVGFGKNDRSLSGRLVFVSGSCSTLFKGGASCIWTWFRLICSVLVMM